MNALPTIFWLAATIAAYVLSVRVHRRWTSPLTTPIALSTGAVIAALSAMHEDVRDYALTRDIITTFLGPATVALAIPLFNKRKRLQTKVVPALIGLAAGSVATMAIAILAARAFGFSPTLASSLAVKSATTPIATEVAKTVHGDPTLAAIFAVCTGTLGAAIGPWFLDRIQVRHPVARGIAFGTISHGIGTAQAAKESEVTGAISGAAIVVAGVSTAVLAPLLLWLLIR